MLFRSPHLPMWGPGWVSLGHTWSKVEAVDGAPHLSEVTPCGCDGGVAPGEHRACSGDLWWSPST